MKKILALSLALALVLALAACGTPATPPSDVPPSSDATKDQTPAAEFSVAMVTDVGGVNDQSFNQSAWEGVQKCADFGATNLKYLESKQEGDYITNLDKMVDEGHNIVWGIGFLMADAILDAAKKNPTQAFGIIDNDYGAETPANVTGVTFKVEEPSFVAGYIAAASSKSGKVGFIGGIKIPVIDQFEYGYLAGVAYANKELGKNVTVEVQYADSFNDAAKGKSIANSMYAKDVDIIFHAAGGVGIGLFESAVENNKFAIGVDSDQSYLAPKNTLTSVMKLVGQAVYNVSKELNDGQTIGGKTVSLDTKSGCVGIAPNTAGLIDAEVYSNALKVQDAIAAGTIAPPSTEDGYKAYADSLK